MTLGGAWTPPHSRRTAATMMSSRFAIKPPKGQRLSLVLQREPLPRDLSLERWSREHERCQSEVGSRSSWVASRPSKSGAG